MISAYLFIDMEVIMDIKDRIKSYEPLFDQWLFDEIIDVYNQECLIKLKHQSYANKKRTAYLNVITVYDQNDNIKEYLWLYIGATK